MRRLPSTGFNKEKLIFLGVTALLGLSLYNMLISAPVTLMPPDPVSSLSGPGPLDREKPDTRVADVLYYIDRGTNPMTGAVVMRDRKNPFEPIDDFQTAAAPKVPQPKNGGKPTAAVVDAEPPPAQEKPEPVKKEKKSFGPTTKTAKVDFSGVMTMNGATYGLLKSKDGQTIQVKEGDYLEDFKYTVSKIEKQAIYVSDEDNQMFVARDTTFDEGGASGGGDEGGEEKKPKKKPAAKPKPPDKVADAAHAPAANANPQPQAQNGRGGRGGRGGAGAGDMGGGRGNTGGGRGGKNGLLGGIENLLKGQGKGGF